ncbi:MAG: DUF167 domain-containing protein [Candidatus Spechtbacterales bacterium]|nr:DUF167 domain-containing protein [Candidatus Spechtbacterales bacterium]
MKINVHVNAGAKSPSVQKIDDITYRVRVNAPAQKGAANRRLIDILSEYFKVPKTHVTIVAGDRSKVKIIKIIDN